MPPRTKPMARGAMMQRSSKPKRGKRKASETARIYGPEAFRDWLSRRPCTACDGGPCECHHITGDGMGRKAHFSLIIPLCRRCHQEWHGTGRHSFQAKYRFTAAIVAEDTHRAWQSYSATLSVS